MPPLPPARDTEVAHWAAHDDAPWRIVQTSPDTTLFLLLERHGPCEQYCRFCPHGLQTDRATPDIGPETQRVILEQFQEALTHHTTPDLFLVSADILAYPGLSDLLKAATTAGRHVTVGTPGTRLCDPDILALLVEHGVSVDLTLLSTEPARHEAIVRNPHAAAELHAGILAALRAHVTIHFAVVVLQENVGGLAALLTHAAERYRADEVQLRVFYPDMAEPQPTYLDQFPDLAALREQLSLLDGLDGPKPALTLGNMPLCQLDPRDYPHIQLEVRPHQPHQNTFDHPRDPVCHECPLRSQCVGIHPHYAAHRPVAPIELESTQAWLTQPEPESPTPTSPAEHGILPGEGRLPGDGIARGQGILPGEGRPRGAGLLPHERPPAPTPSPGGIPKNQGIPKGMGILPGEGRPPGGPRPEPTNRRRSRGHGVLPGEGIPRERGRLPVARPPRAPQGTGSKRRYPLLTLRGPGTAPVRSVCFAPDGRWLFSLHGGRRPHVMAWDLHQRRAPSRWLDLAQRWLGASPEGHPSPQRLPFSVHDDARCLGSDGTSLLLRTTRPGTPSLQVLPWPQHQPRRDIPAPGGAKIFAPTGQGDTWLVGGDGLCVQTTQGRLLRRLLDTSHRVESLHVTQDYRVLVCAPHGPPTLLHIDGRGPISLPITSEVRHATISRHGTWLAVLDDSHVTVLDLKNRRIRWRRPSGGGLRHVVITPDERHLVCTGGTSQRGTITGHTMRLWNIDAGMKRADLVAHAEPVEHLALAPDGRTLASANGHGELLLWDLTPEISR